MNVLPPNRYLLEEYEKKIQNKNEFITWWLDYERRSDQSLRIAELLLEKKTQLGLKQANTLLSIGPAAAEIERHLVQYAMPSLETAYVVEPVELFVQNFVSIMQMHDVRTIAYKQLLQDFTTTPKQVDVILMTHVAYYFAKDFKNQISKVLELLSDDGVLIFATKDDNEFTSNLVRHLPCRKPKPGFDVLPSVANFRSIFRELDVDSLELETEHHLDLKDTRNNDGYVSLLLNRKVTAHEITDLCKNIKRHCRPGTQKLYLKDKIFIIRKKIDQRLPLKSTEVI